MFKRNRVRRPSGPKCRSSLPALLFAASWLSLSSAGIPTSASQDTLSRSGLEDPQFNATLADMESRLREGNRQAGIPGMSAALVDGDGVLWTCAIGVTDSTTLREVTHSTMFSLQSISKLVTATAIMIAVQDGLLDLDTPITAYLPQFTVNSRYEEHPAEKMTLRLLLSHRAGFTHEAPYGNNFELGETSFERHIESISQTWLRYPVGERYAYSNLGVDLAGYILQVVSGKPFARFVEERLLDPLGMSDTTYDWDVIQGSENRASGYDKNNPNVPLRHALIPCGGCFSSAEDMATFIRFHLNGGVANGRRILATELLDEMYEMQGPFDDQVFGYGLGIVKGWLWGDTVYSYYYLTHNGSGFGFNASVQWFPEFELGAAVLVSGGSSYFASEMANNLLKFAISQVGELNTRGIFAGVDSLEFNGRWLDDWLGTYIRPSKLLISKDAGGYSISTGGDNGRPLTPISADDAYYKSDSGFVTLLHFLQGTSGQPKYIAKVHRGETYDYNDGPTDRPGPNKPEWSAYTGQYELIRRGQVADTANVTVQNGYLYIDSWKLKEHLPGLFFTAHGEALDLRGDDATYRNTPLRKVAAD